MGDDGAVALDHRDAAANARLERLAPVRRVGRGFEHAALTRARRQQVAAVFVGIAAGGVRKLVDEAFGPEGVLGVCDAAPGAGADMGANCDGRDRLVGDTVGKGKALVAGPGREEGLGPGGRQPVGSRAPPGSVASAGR